MLSVTLYLFIISGLVIWVHSTVFLPTNCLNIRRNPGEELESWLKKINFHRLDLPEYGRLPSYKFYSEVVEILLSLARRVGGTYQEPILFLREGLQEDRQFEKKLKEIILGCWFQMLMMLALTWAFMLGAMTIVEIPVSLTKLMLIGFWQALGLILLPLLLRFFRKRFFGDIGKLWKMLFILNSLARVPLSRTEIFTMAEIQELKKLKQRSLMHIVEKLKDLCQRSIKLGGSYEEEVKYLMGELRFQEKWHFELFEKRLTVIKLALLSVFFLPAYLAFVFLLLGDLMALM